MVPNRLNGPPWPLDSTPSQSDELKKNATPTVHGTAAENNRRLCQQSTNPGDPVFRLPKQSGSKAQTAMDLASKWNRGKIDGVNLATAAD